MVPALFRSMIPSANSDDASSAVGTREIVLIFILGVVLRLFACQYTYIVNPDGVYYIHQAKAIYYGEWNSIRDCFLTFLSVYPFFIAGAYSIFESWVFAAKFVSFFFGSMTLVPLYFLFRRFFDRDISALNMLIFAVMPVFVTNSADVIRGPACWFFLAVGLYFFVSSAEEGRRLPLFLSCLAFLVAAWARIESVLFILISLVYLAAVPTERRIRKLIFFSLPLMSALFLIFCAIIFLDKPLEQTLRLKEVVEKLSAPIAAYSDLRAELADLIEAMKGPNEGTMPHFLHKARHMVWLVALGTLIKYMMRAFFYHFFIILVLGLGGFWHGLKTDRRVLYLSVLALSMFVLLYMHVLQTWMMFNRFWTVFMLPASVFIGFGLHKAVQIVGRICRLEHAMTVSLMCFLILACAFPKDLKTRERDKIVYREIGEFIAQREGHSRPVSISKSLRTPDWTPFYANLNYAGAPCPQTHLGIVPKLFDVIAFKDYDNFIKLMKGNSVDYFLWEEKAWPRVGFDFLAEKKPSDLKALGSWRHPDAGSIILYRLQP